MSTHAEAAKLIRKELKHTFPNIKFSVISRTYAGGNGVNVQWENGPTRATVRSLIVKYECGHFNPMEDIYEYTNCRKDIPQVDYVHVQRRRIYE